MSRSPKPVDFAELRGRVERAQQLLEGVASPEERATVLAARAEAVAQAPAMGPVGTSQVFAFRVGHERYAVQASDVLEVLSSEGLAELPGAPTQILGAINVRSKVVVVVDLRPMLNPERCGAVDLLRVVVVRAPGGPLGLAVEAIEGVVSLPVAEDSSPEAPFLRVTSDRLALLDLEWLEGRVGA